MGRKLLAVAALALTLGVGCGKTATRPEATASATQQHSTNTCQEDEACWDWRTMGDHAHGICFEGKNVIEHADGAREPGGRGCQSVPLMTRCVEQALVVTTRIPLPVGWKFSCPEGRSMPNGVAMFDIKLIKIGDSAGDGDDVTLRHVIAHEICHAVLWTAGDKSQGNPATIAQAEQAADACAARKGF